MRRYLGSFLLSSALLAIASYGILSSTIAVAKSSGRVLADLTPATNDCDDIVEIFARGSGGAMHDKDETAWRLALDNMLQDSGLTYSFYELGTTEQQGELYPAVAIEGSASNYLNLLGAGVGSGNSFSYGRSVESGRRELINYVKNTAKMCPQTKYILGGYSQGAQVLSKVMQSYDDRNIIYVATFGDPKIYLPEGQGLVPDACRGENLSSYRAKVDDCRAYEGILGSYRPYHIESYEGKVGTWCHQKDIMCSSYWSIQDHNVYDSEKIYEQAAKRIKIAVKREFKDAWRKTQKTQIHDVAILIDTTTSMRDSMPKYLRLANRIANHVRANNGRVAIYDYKDLEDGYLANLWCSTECTQAEFEEALERIGDNLSGGGDPEESALAASKKVMSEMSWRQGAVKSLVLITDAGFHNPDRDGTTFEDVVNLSLRIDPVNFFVLTNNKNQYQDLASQTGGKVFGFNEIGILFEDLVDRNNITLDRMSYSGRVGEVMDFYADNIDSSKFEWDLDGDGVFEVITSEPFVTKIYSELFSGMITVRAKDVSKWQSMATAQVEIEANEGLSLDAIAKITEAEITLSNENALVEFDGENIERVLVVLDEAILGYVDGEQKQIVIEDYYSDMTVRLIPYNAELRRGEAVQLSINDSDMTSISERELSSDSNNIVTSSLELPIVLAPNAGVPIGI